MYMYVENRVATRERLLLYYFITTVIIYCYNYYRSRIYSHVVKIENEYVMTQSRNFCRLDQYSLDLPKQLYSHLV